MKSILHYIQNLDEARFQKWAPDYHRWFDVGSKKQTDLYDLGAIKVPVAIWTGLNDLVADPTDARWISEQLGDNCVRYEEIAGGHSTFQLGIDMTFFTQGVMGVL